MKANISSSSSQKNQTSKLLEKDKTYPTEAIKFSSLKNLNFLTYYK